MIRGMVIDMNDAQLHTLDLSMANYYFAKFSLSGAVL
jgi:hypothetical protein